MRWFVERMTARKCVPWNEVAHVLCHLRNVGHTTKQSLRRFDNAEA